MMQKRPFAPPSFEFGKLTYQEIQAGARAGWLAVIPTGCTEQQGPHLPVDFDTWFAEAAMVGAAERAARQYRVHALVLPAMPFGPTPEHRNFGSGYIDIPVPLHEALYRAVLDSLADQGFQRIVLWRGCGEHDLQAVVTGFNRGRAGQARAFLPASPSYDIWCRLGDPELPAGHADSFTTSIMMYHDMDRVRIDRIYDPQNETPDWDDPSLDFARYSESGVIGDPTGAGAALGAELWDAVLSYGAGMLKEIAEEKIGSE